MRLLKFRKNFNLKNIKKIVFIFIMMYNNINTYKFLLIKENYVEK